MRGYRRHEEGGRLRERKAKQQGIVWWVHMSQVLGGLDSGINCWGKRLKGHYWLASIKIDGVVACPWCTAPYLQSLTKALNWFVFWSSMNPSKKTHYAAQKADPDTSANTAAAVVISLDIIYCIYKCLQRYTPTPVYSNTNMCWQMQRTKQVHSKKAQYI